jgi:hypothetical protein
MLLNTRNFLSAIQPDTRIMYWRQISTKMKKYGSILLFNLKRQLDFTNTI